MKKLITLLLLLLLLVEASRAQYQQFYSQYIYSGLLINPAYAGSQDALNITAAYRNQWTGFSGAPKNYSLAAHTPLRNKKVNLGLVVATESFGITSKTEVNIAYAFRIIKIESSLSFGLQAGLDLYKEDWNKVVTTDPNDPNFIPRIENKTIPKFGGGIYYTTKKLYAGLAFPTLYKIDAATSFSSLAMNLYSGMLIKVKNDVVIKPSVLLKYLPASPLQYDITGTFYVSKLLGVGFGYRSSDAIYALLDIKITDQFNLGYSYDFTTSKLKNYSGGSHELMLRYLFKYSVNSKSVRYF